jgi:murein DD-endopeptidase MepM/ murein hydrolase activator NlpD
MKRIIFALGVLIIGSAIVVRADTSSTTPVINTDASAAVTNLQTQIQQKQQQLRAVNDQLASTTVSLRQTQSQKTTLQQQIQIINGSLTTLNLGIQADTIKTQQLQLEQQVLQGDMQDIHNSIEVKVAAIASAMQELQRNDATNSNLLTFLLKRGTLADTVFAANSIIDLQGQLSADIGNLKSLNQEYDGKLHQNVDKQSQIVAQQQDLKDKKSLVQDQQQQKTILLATTKNQETLFQKQLKSLQQQQEEINTQIEAIDALLRTKIDPTTLPSLGTGVLGLPIAGSSRATLTQGYGATAFAQTEYVHHWHNGLDFAASLGTPILAAADGVVDAAANEDLYCPRGAYGKFITINHFNGLTTLYGHLSKQLVKAGDHVVRGQVIGYSGSTGAATGPHLHFTVFAQSTYYVSNSKLCGPLPQGGDLNPAGYLF